MNNAEWWEKTWKIVTGCRHNCPYCYVRRFTYDMEPKFHEDRLREPIALRTPTMLFVANTGDLFGDWAPDIWIEKTFKVMQACPQHLFLLLTKNPVRYEKIPADWWRPNIWAGTSVTCAEDTGRIYTLKKCGAALKYISFEPVLDDMGCLDLTGISWAIVGAETAINSYTPKDEEKSKEIARPLFSQILSQRVPLFMKRNLHWYPRWIEFPKQYHEWEKAKAGLQGTLL